jgi:AraC-like DNA-binding protein
VAMVPARSVEQFVANPVGMYVGGPTYLVWCSTIDLGGTVVWGRPDESDAQAIARLWEYDHQLRAGYDALTDLSRLEGANPVAFEVLMGYARTRLDSYATRMRRHAIVHSAGVIGSVVAGFYPLLGPTHDWQLFVRTEDALAWLNHGDVIAELLPLVEQVLGIPASLQRCREWLERNLVHVTIGAAARALALSPRALQRQLLAANTSFRDEVERTRAAQARVLLASTDMKIEAIAQQIGCTRSHLNRFCMRAFELTPAELRARMRDSAD